MKAPARQEPAEACKARRAKSLAGSLPSRNGKRETSAGGSRWGILDLDKLEFEDQRAVRRDIGAAALLAVRQFAGNEEFPFRSDGHHSERLLEPFDHSLGHGNGLTFR